MFRTSALMFSLLVSAPITGCAPAHDGGALADTGTLELALTTEIDGSSYELIDASFVITDAGGAEIQATSEPGALNLVQELPVGDYGVLLAEGWRLIDSAEPEIALNARLLSDNPLSFSVLAGETTLLQFVFGVLEPSDVGATGSVALGIDVVKESAKGLLFTEVMSNPAALSDSSGEWVELRNVGQEPIALQGCKLLRDGKGYTIESGPTVEPGASVALANSEAPGFTPAVVYSSVTLPNTALFTLEIQCQGVTLDSITVDPSTWPGGNGVAAQLSGVVDAALGNDDPALWCDATTSYATDLGTPGAANAECP